MGLTINVVNKLERYGRLKNIRIDANNNLRYNEAFISYKKTVGDFSSFELNNKIPESLWRQDIKSNNIIRS